MPFSKICICGNKEVEIFEDTNANIRYATKEEQEAFQKKHWDWPEELPCYVNMWESLCSTLNALENSFWKNGATKIWKRCLEALKHYDYKMDTLNKCRFTLINKGNAVYQIQIDAAYSYSIKEEQEDEWGFPLLDANGNPLPPKITRYTTTSSTFCNYPQDFGILLDVVEQRIAEKMDTDNLSSIQNSSDAFRLIQKYENKWSKKNKQNRLKLLRFLNTYLSDIRQFNQYRFAHQKVLLSANFKEFWESEQMVLDVDDELFFAFENACGFDLHKKKAEIEHIKTKLSNSKDTGEGDVKYALDWALAAADSYIISIKNNCENKYRYNCIQLCKPDFKKESQEYDHILVCSGGIILIETKNWKGTFKIHSDGKWTKKTADHTLIGLESPKFQLRRHEVLMQNILPNVPIYSFLCFSNASTLIYGKEYFTEYPIITPEQLDAVLSELCAIGRYSIDDINYMASVIDAHKVIKP